MCKLIPKPNNAFILVMHREDLLSRLKAYRTPFMEEAAMVRRTLQFVREHINCFDRALLHGHVTGSAWVLNPARTHTLMMHHRKIGLWLQPGGHADGNPDIQQVVLKETSEESGIPLPKISLVDEDIFDVDIHTVYPSEHDDRHEHFDVRFLVEIDDHLEIPGNSESHQIGWIALDEVSHFNNALSLRRMIQKTRMMLS